MENYVIQSLSISGVQRNLPTFGKKKKKRETVADLVKYIIQILLCNIHPLMMFQKKMKELSQELYDLIGKNRIKECFLVDIDFHSERFVIKSINSLSNFICKKYSAKPWKRCNQFGEHIKPKKNMAMSLKDHWFNCLQD